MSEKLLYVLNELTTYTHRLDAIEHYHINCEFVLVLNGEAINTFNGIAKNITRGDVFFVNTSHAHSILQTSKNHEHIDIYISPERLKNICATLFDEEYYNYLTTNDNLVEIFLNKEEFSAITERIFNLEIESQLLKGEKGESISKKCIQAIIIQLLEVQYEWLNTNYKKYPEWMVSFLQKTQNPEIFSKSIDEIMRLSNYSHTHFGRLFKNYFKKPFKNYINELRLDYAKMLLTSQNFSVLDISLIVGYNSLSHFIQRFKNYVGQTPLKYRNLFLSQTIK